MARPKHDRKLDERCPKCWAKPGDHCRNHKGNRKRPCRLEDSRLSKAGQRIAALPLGGYEPRKHDLTSATIDLAFHGTAEVLRAVRDGVLAAITATPAVVAVAWLLALLCWDRIHPADRRALDAACRALPGLLLAGWHRLRSADDCVWDWLRDEVLPALGDGLVRSVRAVVNGVRYEPEPVPAGVLERQGRLRDRRAA